MKHALDRKLVESLTTLSRTLAPSFSADKFTRHSNESFETVASVSAANIPNADIISEHSYNNSCPSFDPVKPIEN